MRSSLASPPADVTTTVDVDDIAFYDPTSCSSAFTEHVNDARTERADQLPPAEAMS
jgi:hypothetical protein